MKKKLISMFAIFAIAFSCMFGFVGCGNKQEEAPAEETPAETTATLKAEDVAGTYKATTVNLKTVDNAEGTDYTFEEYVEMDDENPIKQYYLSEFFGIDGLYIFDMDANSKTVKMLIPVGGDGDPEIMAVADWSVENNKINFEYKEDFAQENTTIAITRADNGNISVTITFTDTDTENDASFVAVLTLVKQA